MKFYFNKSFAIHCTYIISNFNFSLTIMKEAYVKKTLFSQKSFATVELCSPISETKQ